MIRAARWGTGGPLLYIEGLFGICSISPVVLGAGLAALGSDLSANKPQRVLRGQFDDDLDVVLVDPPSSLSERIPLLAVDAAQLFQLLGRELLMLKYCDDSLSHILNSSKEFGIYC